MLNKCHTTLFILVIIALSCIAESTNGVRENPRQKRSPKPQFPKFIYRPFAKLISKVIPKVHKKGVKFVSDNPGKIVGGGAAVAVVSVAAAGIGKKRPRPGCEVYIRHLKEKQPVFLDIGALMIPVDGYLNWNVGDKSWIACPSSSDQMNSINGLYRVSAEIECVGGHIFKYVHNSHIINITNVYCDQRATGNVRRDSNIQCPGSYKAVGFNVSFPIIGYKFFDLYHLCFNESAATTVYTTHTLYGNEISHKCYSSKPQFKSAGFSHRNISWAYNIAWQKDELTNLFRSYPNETNPQGSTDDYYNLSNLQRGHLNPDADQLFTTWQWSTYFYINVVGMWQQINNGNWKNLENNVRTLAANSSKTYKIYTGTFDTLSLCSRAENCPKFTLSDGRIPVPKWLWKIVKFPELDAAIALVVSNNPFVHVNPICSLGGESYGWNSTINSNLTRGAVSYCAVNDLMRVVPTIPSEALANNILSFEVS
ncbi:uncharacterized protein LOC134219788 [Armigeres subalbatus]|uniref:uncharacterized protein LOC134219788 n=1 Tax=Armigeres subalbatus TaxID=124917 RepID=UPI002ED58631